MSHPGHYRRASNNYDNSNATLIALLSEARSLLVRARTGGFRIDRTSLRSLEVEIERARREARRANMGGRGPIPSVVGINARFREAARRGGTIAGPGENTLEREEDGDLGVASTVNPDSEVIEPTSATDGLAFYDPAISLSRPSRGRSRRSRVPSPSAGSGLPSSSEISIAPTEDEAYNTVTAYIASDIIWPTGTAQWMGSETETEGDRSDPERIQTSRIAGLMFPTDQEDPGVWNDREDRGGPSRSLYVTSDREECMSAVRASIGTEPPNPEALENSGSTLVTLRRENAPIAPIDDIVVVISEDSDPLLTAAERVEANKLKRVEMVRLLKEDTERYDRKRDIELGCEYGYRGFDTYSWEHSLIDLVAVEALGPVPPRPQNRSTWYHRPPTNPWELIQLGDNVTTPTAILFTTTRTPPIVVAINNIAVAQAPTERFLHFLVIGSPRYGRVDPNPVFLSRLLGPVASSYRMSLLDRFRRPIGPASEQDRIVFERLTERLEHRDYHNVRTHMITAAVQDGMDVREAATFLLAWRDFLEPWERPFEDLPNMVSLRTMMFWVALRRGWGEWRPSQEMIVRARRDLHEYTRSYGTLRMLEWIDYNPRSNILSRIRRLPEGDQSIFSRFIDENIDPLHLERVLQHWLEIELDVESTRLGSETGMSRQELRSDRIARLAMQEDVLYGIRAVASDEAQEDEGSNS